MSEEATAQQPHAHEASNDSPPPSVAESEDNFYWKTIVLGCGPSTSVPKLYCLLSKNKDCVCGTVAQKPENGRLNPSIVLQKLSKKTNAPVAHVLVDVGKTIREAVLRHFVANGIPYIDSIILTHGHVDAVGGLDDVRDLQRLNTSTDIYMDLETKNIVQQMFPYLFPSEANAAKLANMFTGKLVPKIIQAFEPFHVNGLEVHPIPMYHGTFLAMGFIFSAAHLEHQFVYFSDFRCRSVHKLPEDNAVEQTEGTTTKKPNLAIAHQNLEELTFLVDREKTLRVLQQKPISVMILDCLKYRNHYISHSNFEETCELIRIMRDKFNISPQQIYFTGMGCDIDYTTVNTKLLELFPNGTVKCGHDGLSFTI